ncbi:MAG: penicillin-insensitive murein endopeptidase, partial [Nannocystaceae bacterium]|nr:penicillin-insensitive murein endopeptidase [Nannocystaceae bacterium]
VVSLAAGAYFVLTSDDSEASVAATTQETATAKVPAAPESPTASAGATQPKVAAEAEQNRAAKNRVVPSLEKISWTTDTPSTLQELARTWSVPRDALTKLNPDLSPQKQLASGVQVVVYSRSLGATFSVGPPNNGRLTRGVPLPEDDAWALPEDRSRAFATAETIAALTTGLHTYALRFPEAQPVQVGDLSARRGGKIFGHQSHQTGLDVDIRLIRNSAGDDFDADRNWFLIKTMIDGSEVTAIFLNATEQTWLRAAAEADVGAPSAEGYFALIHHEPGHTIHTHIRFACPKANKRCVPYPLPDTAEQDAKSKLPTALGKVGRNKRRLPRVRVKKKKKKLPR